MVESVSVVLGAGGGIGRACALEFAARGRRVVAADLNLESLQATVAGMPEASVARMVDVTRPAALRALFLEVEEHGVLCDLVYAPGVVITSAIDRTDWAAYRRLMAVNLDGAFYASAAFVSAFARCQGRPGSIVLISSTAGLRGEAGATAYCASKFGLIGLAESLAAELADRQIRVNAVCPGNVDTPMLRDVVRQIAEYEGTDANAVRDRLTHEGAASRLVRAEEVASACWYCCDPDASAITGTTLRVDGGQMVG